MNPLWIITVFVIVDELLAKGGHRDHQLAQVSDAEVLTVALVAAKYFHNNHERALLLLQETHYLSGRLSVSRFNRRLHQHADWLDLALEVLGEVAARGDRSRGVGPPLRWQLNQPCNMGTMVPCVSDLSLRERASGGQQVAHAPHTVPLLRGLI